MDHSMHPELLASTVRIMVVGCGGNSSAVATGLPYLHQGPTRISAAAAGSATAESIGGFDSRRLLSTLVRVPSRMTMNN